MTNGYPYYIQLDRSVGEDFSEYEFDHHGVPMVRFQRSKQWRHNPVTVCQYALSNYNYYLESGELKHRLNFLHQADWLMKNHDNGPENSAVWPYRIDIPFYGLKSPWISGMAQGEAISVLLRAHRLTGQVRYMEIAERSWRLFFQPDVFMSAFPDGGTVIEEYPTQTCSCVLNGFILSLFGVYDYHRFTGAERAERLFEDCVQSLKNNLFRYDTGHWSLYDLYPPLRLTSRSYHRLHLRLLKALFSITGEKYFEEMRIRWEDYLSDPVSNLSWAFQKLKQRMTF
ncbi:MAG: D-glucuronyl C5-epimerase family protein [candidate division KSB1 bacterium]|jgi:hypothetical protein|nr:D-glucuronyl C5-epimerase family protein [candidate division KSB1 bacterium]